VAVLTAGCGGRNGGADAPPLHPTIVLLSIDTLRPDHLGAWGYERATSPFLDELAARGTRFADAWAPAPWTLPSHATMLSGLLPRHHGAVRSELSIDREAPWLPEALAGAGYATCGVVTSIFVSDEYGFARGFAHFFDFGLAEESREDDEAPDAEEVFAHALEWAAAQPADQPLFLFLHVYDAHYPCAAPPPWNELFDRSSLTSELRYEDYFYYQKHPLTPKQLEHQINQYDEEIAYVDATFRDFVGTWTANRPQTVFLVVADHGEELGERGSWGHGHTLYPEQLHVPWLVAGPGIRKQVVEQRVGLTDLAATIAGLAGVPFAEGDGLDRTEQLRTGREVGPDRVAGRFASTNRRATVKHRWHEPPFDLIVDLQYRGTELYDLATDPHAEHDLHRERRNQVATMRRNLYAWLGEPWEAEQDGRLTTDGVFVHDGQAYREAIDMTAGTRFAVFPLDAEVNFLAADGTRVGPYSVASGDLPNPDDPCLGWHGKKLAIEAVPLSEEQQERLRSLGY
jgi:arylsulfatase A-like enzyme